MALIFFSCGEKCNVFPMDIRESLTQENHIQDGNEQVASSLRSVLGLWGRRSQLAELALQHGDQISPFACFSKFGWRE